MFVKLIARNIFNRSALLFVPLVGHREKCTHTHTSYGVHYKWNMCKQMNETRSVVLNLLGDESYRQNVFFKSSSTALTPFAHRNYCILYSFLPSLNVFFEAKFHASVIFLALDFCTDLQWRKNVNLIEPSFSSPLSVNNIIFFSKFYFSSMFSIECHSWWIILKLH